MDVAREFREWRRWAAGNAPLYEELARQVAADDALGDLARSIPEEKTRPTLFFAAVHASLLRDPDHDLAAHYPTVSGSYRAPAARNGSAHADVAAVHGDASHADGPDLEAAFADFCAEREAELRAYFETRRTQTNAVGRCSALYPAFAHVADTAGDEPLALVEVGPSAGLNLLFDRYAYDYWRGGASPLRVGATDSSVEIETDLRAGSPPLPAEPPTVVSRVGVDVEPLDVTDEADRRWIRALAWPEHERRHRVLEDALDLAAERPPSIVAGDAIERLPELVETAPEDVPVCVFDTLVLYHLDDDYRERFEATLRDLAADRRLYWLDGETVSDDYEQALELDLVRPGEGTRERLATFEMHGRWLRWEA